jgi:hypothetical protein
MDGCKFAPLQHEPAQWSEKEVWKRRRSNMKTETFDRFSVNSPLMGSGHPQA